jgi:uncharacterized damage-inducible protein DinB
MPIADSLLPEYDHEVATTRKLLERVPDDRLGWKPHDRSMSIGQLASHLATMLSWGSMTLNQSEIDLSGPYNPPDLKTRADLLASFDKEASTTRAALAEKSDPEMMAMWSLKREGKTIFSMPKVAVLRSFVMNHMIHHRGQLSVYLRLNDVPVPSMYGPSADEGQF